MIAVLNCRHGADRIGTANNIFNSDVRCINGIKKLLADRFMEFSDKLVLNTSLERKPTELAIKSCIIEKAISVSHRKFEAITKAPLRDEPLIAENKDIMYFVSKGFLKALIYITCGRCARTSLTWNCLRSL